MHGRKDQAGLDMLAVDSRPLSQEVMMSATKILWGQILAVGLIVLAGV